LSSDYTIQPAFVVGQRRSGTNLLGRLLNSHPDIAISGELEFTVAYDPAALRTWALCTESFSITPATGPMTWVPLPRRLRE
jgi:hypothetical protein